MTGESPLVDTQSAAVSGNVDRRQMEELPPQGRNWMELSMMIKGRVGRAARATERTSKPLSKLVV